MNSLQKTSGKTTVLFGGANKVTVIFRRKRQGLCLDKWIIHYNTVPAHDALRMRELLAKNSITKTDQPPY